MATVFQYWLETALGLSLLWGVYLALWRRAAMVFRKAYILLAPAAALIIPLLYWNFNGDSLPAALSVLPVKWLAIQELWPGGAAQITGVHIASMVYFVVAAILLFRLSDRLPSHGLQRQSIQIFSEGGWALFWFQPFLLPYLRELRAMESLPMHPSRPKNLQSAAATIATAGALWLLFWLFAADEVCRTPQWHWVENKTNRWQMALEQPLFQIGTPRQPQTLLGWGGYWTALHPLKPDSLSRFPVRSLSPFEFYSVFNHPWTWQKDGWSMKPNSVEALVVFPLLEPQRLASLDEIMTFLSTQRYATEMTLFVKIEDEDQHSWLGVIGVSEKGRVYGFEELLQTWGREMPLLRWKTGQNGKQLAELHPHSPYTLVWGPLRLPLDLQANPDIYGIFADFELEQIRDLLPYPIEFYRGDSLLARESLTVSLWNQRQQDYYAGGTRRLRVLDENAYLDIAPADLQPAMTLTMVARLAGGVQVNAVNLYIRDGDTPYDPLFRAPGFPRPDSLYSFQLITRDQPPSILKVDTTLARNEKILSMYRRMDTYRIAHVPGFQTYTRLLQSPAEPMALLRAEGFPLDSVFRGDFLPELSFLASDSVFLEWGAMFAAPNSKVYLLEEFQEQMPDRPRLHAKGEELRMQSFVLYFFQEKNISHAEWFDQKRAEAWDSASFAPQIRSKSTIVIDHLVVEDETGKAYSVPHSFAFHIGKSQRDVRWRVQVASAEPGEPERLREENALHFRHYPLTDLISQLVPQPKNRIEFKGLSAEPLLDVSLTASGPLPARAEEFILNELQKQFRFDFSYERLARPNWRLHIKDAALLEQARYTGGKLPLAEKIHVFQWEGTHSLRGVSLNEMSAHLEKRFDVIIEWFPNAFLNDHYLFSLDCSSLASVQRQLEDEYGIVFQRMDTLWQGLVVRFY